MTKSGETMTVGPIWKRMVFFALPLMLGNLFQQMYNTVDALIVGNFLPNSALAAVTSSGSLIFMLIGFFNGVAMGAGVIVARYYGAQDRVNLEKAVHTTVAAGIIAGIVMTLVGIFLTPYILVLMHTPDSVMHDAVTYLQVYFAGAFALIMYNIFVGILHAVGDSKHPLIYLIISSITNIILDYVFIRFLKTGVEGAAFATVISQFISMTLCLIQLLRAKGPYRLQLKKLRFDKKIFVQIVKIGLPSGIQNSIIAIANLLVQSNINGFMEDAISGIGTYNKIEGFGFLPITSFSMAITTFVSQNIGAKQYDRAKKGAKFGIVTTVLLAELIGIIIFIFAEPLISAFSDKPEVIAFGVGKARISSLFFCLLAASHAMAALLRGVGKSMVPMMIMLICWCIIRVTFISIVVPLTHSIDLVNWVYPITWSLSTISFLIYLKKVNFKKLVEKEI